MRPRFTLAIGLAVLVATVYAFAAIHRVNLVPKFSPGQVMRYRIESGSKSTGKTTGPIANPEGGSQSSNSIHMVVRLEVLSLAVEGGVRLRATYEKSSAQSEADALDLSANSFSSRYTRLEGRTFEFTLEPDGKVTNTQDLTAAAAGESPKAIEPVLTWLAQVVPGTSFPKNGISVGQKWTRERPVEGAVLSGLALRSESAYVRNESCGSNSPASSTSAGAASGLAATECAVILTQFQITRRGSSHADATPDDYRRNGLRTSGTWTGSGESLDSYSLATGLLVSSTQSSTQNMDYQVTSAGNGSSVRYVGKIQAQSQITLVPSP